MNIIEIVKEKFPDQILDSHTNYGDNTIVVDRTHLLEIMNFLKVNREAPFDLLLDLCGVDYFGREPRFEVVYHLYSLPTTKRLRVKTAVPEGDLNVASMIKVWEAADWFEREAFDMFGIHFSGHPNLTRILMWKEFEGHPLRKDYPIRKRQAIPTLADIV